MGACAQRKGGSREGGKVSVHWEAPHRRDQGGNAVQNLGELGKVADLEGRIQRAAFLSP